MAASQPPGPDPRQGPQQLSEQIYVSARPGGQPPTDGNAIASLVLGICGFFFWPCGFILGTIGLILGMKSRRETGSGMALAGIILSSIALGISILVIGIYVLIFLFMAVSAP